VPQWTDCLTQVPQSLILQAFCQNQVRTDRSATSIDLPYREIQISQKIEVLKRCVRQSGYELRYIPATSEDCDIQKLLPSIATAGIKELHYADVVDDWLQQRLTGGATEQGINLTMYPSSNFLEDPADVAEFFSSRKSYKQTDFYVDRRKHHREFFLSNPRLGMLVKTFDKMTPEKQQQHLLAADRFLDSI
jgi:deoxyribodipyrimidine photolyase-like uncharacterized protein